MAGHDTEYRGEAQLAPGATVGLLEQEPQLDESKDVRGNVEDGVAETARAARPLQRARRRTTPTRPPTSSRACRTRSTPPTPGTSTPSSTQAMDALRLPPADADVTKLSGGERRRVALCRLLLARARPAAARRAHQPPRRRVGRPGSSATWRSTRARSSPSPTIATSSTTSPAGSSSSTAATGIPFKGNYSCWLEQKQERLAQEEQQGDRAPAHDRARARVGAREPQGPAQEGQGAPEQLRGAARRGAQRQARPGPDPHPGRAAPRRHGDRGRGPAQGLRRPAADRGPLVLAAARGHRRRDRRQRRRQDDAVPDDRRRGAARRRAR